MSCPNCGSAIDLLEKKADIGEYESVESFLSSISALQDESNIILIYCPGCREKIERLRQRIGSRLRKETLANIKDLLDHAYDSRTA